MFKYLKDKFNKFKKWIISILGIGVVLAAGSILAPNQNYISLDNLNTKYEKSSVNFKQTYKLEHNTLKLTPNNNPKDKIEIIIGDKDEALGGISNDKFTPSINFIRWEEVLFSLNPISDFLWADTNNKTLSFADDKILFENSKTKYEMYNTEEAYKYIWYLKEKPANNKIKFHINTKGLDFFYQPPLTDQYQNGYFEELQTEIVVSETQVKDLDGNVLVECPENVVGSYAVYHSTKGGLNDINGKEYKTGKAFHIFRPNIIDAEGKQIWGILNIDIENNIYSVEISKEFLDTAVYPIKSNDEFGYHTIGAYATNYSSNYAMMSGHTYSPATDGTLTSITEYVKNQYLKYAIYNGTALVDYTVGQSLGSSYSWVTQDTTLDAEIFSANSYYLGGKSFNTAYIMFDTGASTKRRYQSSNYSSAFPNPASWTTQNYYYKYSIYATYAGSGGGETPTINRPDIWWE